MHGTTSAEGSSALDLSERQYIILTYVTTLNYTALPLRVASLTFVWAIYDDMSNPLNGDIVVLGMPSNANNGDSSIVRGRVLGFHGATSAKGSTSEILTALGAWTTTIG